VALIIAFACLAQQKTHYDMGKMQMVFLSRSVERKTDERGAQRQSEHRAAVERLIGDGKLALWGEVNDESDLREIGVLKTESAEEARQLTQSLPDVVAGRLEAEVLTWYAAKNIITSPQKPLTTSTYIFGLLLRGPNWTKEETAETKLIQEGHMANINRLAEAGHLVLAGPFVDGGERRGVFIFKVHTLEEAKAFAGSDPAVIAGRLKIELHRWAVPTGMLP
jgi:uncharacterized protein